LVGETRAVADDLPRGPLRVAAYYAAVLVGFAVVTKLGLLFVAPPENVSYFWPAGGFLLAVLTLAPPERWARLLLVIYPAASS
jgi:ABC-type phosphate transport system auxiliary subunit